MQEAPLYIVIVVNKGTGFNILMVYLKLVIAKRYTVLLEWSAKFCLWFNDQVNSYDHLETNKGHMEMGPYSLR